LPIQRAKGLFSIAGEAGIMTISAHQVDNVIKAYNKQIRLNRSPAASQGWRGNEQYVDIVSLSKDFDKKDAYQKISYSLLDVILKNRA
jgi:hypothetical protein